MNSRMAPVAATHAERRVEHFKPPRVKREGWVAWCSCGVGSPLKTTERQARASLAVHVSSDGKEWPS